jgi:hypothetical protein
MSYAFHSESSGVVAAAPQMLFEHLDDPRRLASHMESGSAAMAGASMSIETDSLQGKTVGSVIRMRGRMLGITMLLEEAVTERDPPRLKAWETLGEPRLLVIGRYRMGFQIGTAGRDSLLTVSIHYDLPRGFAGRLLGRLFAPAYARWCCRRILQDAVAAFGQPTVRRPRDGKPGLG